MWDLGAHIGHVHLDIGQLWILVSTFGTHCGDAVKHTRWPLFFTHCIVEMKRGQEEELRKLKANHDPLKAHVRRPKGDEHFAHIFPEHSQGESHPCRTIRTQDDPSLSHIHRSEGLDYLSTPLCRLHHGSWHTPRFVTPSTPTQIYTNNKRKNNAEIIKIFKTHLNKKNSKKRFTST